MNANFLVWLASELNAVPGLLDLVFAASRLDAPDSLIALERRKNLTDHPRVTRALRYREEVIVYADRLDRGSLILGHGLAWRWEVSLEISPAYRGIGLGRKFAEAARSLVLADEPLFAQVAAGNVQSIRAFLAAGFQPICAEVLFLRSDGTDAKAMLSEQRTPTVAD